MGVYQSTDWGVSWTNISAGFPSAVCKSTDTGLGWSAANTGIATISIDDIEVDRTNPARVILGFEAENSGGCYYSSDAAQSWVNVYTGSPDNFESVKYLFIEPGSDDQIVYATYKSEVQSVILKSGDGGNSWNLISGGLPSNIKWYGSLFCDLAINLDNSKIIYLASIQNGVFLSGDGGANWDHANDGVPSNSLSAFSHSFSASSGWNMLASTSTSSAFRTPMVNPGAAIEDHTETNSDISIYPIPSNGLVTIDLQNFTGRIEKIEILTANGSLFRQYSRSLLPTSQLIMIEMPTGEMPAGIYFCRMCTTHGSKHFKVCVIK